jgi:branched-chain amino acid transport system permease protein
MGFSTVLYHFPLPIAILIGGSATGLVGALIGFACLRLRGHYFSIFTFLLIFVAQIFFTNIADAIPGLKAEIWLQILPLDAYSYKVLYYYVFLAELLIVLFLSILIEKSKFGYGLKAIKENEDVAESLGINTTKLKFICSCASAFFGGIVGATYASYISYIDIPIFFSVIMAFDIIFISFLGGTGTWIGPLLGTLIVIPIDEALTVYISPELARISYGIFFVLVILLMPNGLFVFLKKRIGAKYAKRTYVERRENH